MAEPEQHDVPPQTQPTLPGSQDRTCTLCGGLWQRSLGLPPVHTPGPHTDADWAAWASANGKTDPVARWQ
jgi:cellulase/cellobiase CelA1